MNELTLSLLIVATICGLINDYFLSSDDKDAMHWSIPFAFVSVISTITAIILAFKEYR